MGFAPQKSLLTLGFPNGPVIGPVCNIIYINNFPSSIASRTGLFADDTAVFLTISSLSDSRSLQENILSIEIRDGGGNGVQPF